MLFGLSTSLSVTARSWNAARLSAVAFLPLGIFQAKKKDEQSEQETAQQETEKKRVGAARPRFQGGADTRHMQTCSPRSSPCAPAPDPSAFIRIRPKPSTSPTEASMMHEGITNWSLRCSGLSLSHRQDLRFAVVPVLSMFL